LVSASVSSPVSADSTASYCSISNVHVSSTTPTDYSSTIVRVTTTFSVYCSGSPNTVWNIRTEVYADSGLFGVSSVSSSTNQYSAGQGSADYVVNNQFDAMNYYGYGEQTPSFYVEITIINTSTGSLDAQQQTPFGVDTSQYPFNLAQQNYCRFPALSPYFQILPGCSGTANSTVSNATSSGSCNLYGLPQFLQPYLPGCAGTVSQTVSTTTTQSANSPIPGSPLATSPKTPTTPETTATAPDVRSTQAILGIIIAALATFLGMTLILKKSIRLPVSRDHIHLKPLGKFCTECGLHLQPNATFCDRCDEPCPNEQETITFKV
jgi:hypothetical protein